MSDVRAPAAAAAAVEAIDPARIERDLRDLVRIPSITGSEEMVQDRVEALLTEIGLGTARIETDPVAFMADPDFPGAEMPRTSLPVVTGSLGRSGRRRLLLVGHVDVVPPGDPGTWTVDPWAGEIRNGSLYGRGACDMKGGVVSILGALRALVASGAADDLEGEVLAVFVPSEEDGGQGMLAAIRAGCTGDAAVIAEPTGLDVVIAHAGAITFRLVVPGRAAHASVRREGISALDNLYTLIRALEADESARNGAETDPLMTALGLPYPTIIGKIEGGEWASTVLDRVVVEGRYGVRLGQTWRDAEADLRACIEAACAADPFLRDHAVELEITGGRFSSSRVPADDPLPAGVAAAVEATLGRRPALLGEPYGADMRLLVNEGATPTVIFGPGDVRSAHAADEHVPLSEVADCARVLAAWVVRELAPAH
ncbi:MAG TPA: ArgE/DapE family deacylase [Candidatus Limnocylindrales bacterium]|nr:ArgE/DapE family deacylase [Candidatus Limnocylindrales bacterium]